jgi:hypothetical protein
MLLRGRQKRMLLESEIMAAQSISKTEHEASRRLGVSYMTYRKYAKMYGLHGRVMNMGGKGIDKSIKNEDGGKYPLNKILEGKFPNYSTHRLKDRMVRSNRIEQKCNKCGFGEARILDNKIPLLMNYIDGNPKNKLRDNIELLCYNCFFLYVNNPFGCRKTFKIGNEDEVEKIKEKEAGVPEVHFNMPPAQKLNDNGDVS